MKTAPEVSVVIAAHDGAATIGRTLDALRRQDLDGEFEVIVVDDGSTDGTAAAVRAAGLPVRLLTQSQRGAGAARNLGVAEARAGVIAFTDADCFPTAAWLREGLAAIRTADLVQGAVRPDAAAVRHPLERTLWVVEEAGLYETANLFIRRAAFERLGGFEDWLSPSGRPFAEDVWLGWRLRRAGGCTRFCPAAVVEHAVFPSTVGEHLGEAARLAHFPAMAARIPELRDTLFYGRLFLSRHTALFDLAVAGCAAGLALRRPLPLAAAMPYGWRVARAAAGWRRHAPKVVATRVLADLIGLGALVAGGVRAKTPVL